MKKNKDYVKVGLTIFFLVYIAIMCHILFFKNFSLIEIFSDRYYIRTLSLVPFKTIKKYCINAGFLNPLTILNIYGNIVIFIPFGIFISMLIKDKSIKYYSFLTFITTLSIEIVQYIFALGITDIDDVLLNLIGGVFGILVYKLLYAILKDRSKTNKLILFLFIGTVTLFFGTIFILNLMGYRIKLF